jgi:hypothetical protein
MKQVVVRFRLGIGGRSLGPESEFQKLQREVDRDCSVNERTSDIAGAWVPKWADEWIAEFLPNHPSLKKDSE